MNSRNLDILDTLSILSTILQLRNYEAELISANNDDIMKELQKQDREYFERIIRNQEKIIETLARIETG